MVGTSRMKDDGPMSACTNIIVTYKTQFMSFGSKDTINNKKPFVIFLKQMEHDILLKPPEALI